MRSLERARACARECRSELKLAVGLRPAEILKRIQAYLYDEFQIEVAEVAASFLRGRRGEVVPNEGLLYVDKELKIEEKLEVVAHELGHLKLHHEALTTNSGDLLRGSAFLEQGAPALTRYSPRSQEEAEASAFAAEFICPSAEIFDAWHDDPNATTDKLATHFASTPSLVKIQLAEGLYQCIAGDAAPVDPDVHPPTEEQETAAKTTGIPVLVDAGPGTGKTKTLVRRIEYLIQEENAEPEQFLVLTFSNEAATELRERLESRLGTDIASRVLTSTFHGFGVLLLHLFGDHVGLDVDFSIADETAQQETITDLLGTVDCDPLLNLKDPVETASEISGFITFLKDRLVGPEDLQSVNESWAAPRPERPVLERAQALQRVFQAYEEAKKSENKVDFADLISLPYRILLDHDDLRSGIRSKFPWVLVDEYQDVSRATALFLQQIAGPDNPPWVVGDTRQAIYRFRGAEPKNVRLFADDFPGAKSFQLQANYRSTPAIIDAANQLAALLERPDSQEPAQSRWKPGRDVRPVAEKPVRQVSADSDRAERAGIARVVQQWLDEGIDEESIAVLARRNVDVRNIAVALKGLGIRAVTTGILTAEGAGGDLAAVLSAVDQPMAMPRVIYALNRDKSAEVLDPAVRQLLASKPGDEEPVWTDGAETNDVASGGWSLREEFRRSRSEDAWSVLTQFLFFQTDYLRILLTQQVDSAEAAVQVEETLTTLALAATYRFTHPHESPLRARRGFAERLRHLLTHPAPGLIPPRKKPRSVRVMTCHAAKGLEFPCVVVAGQSLPDLFRGKPVLPPQLRPDEAADLLQADSLLFVGVTRAERAVVVSHAATASGTPRSRQRTLPKLLVAWLKVIGQEPELWAEGPSTAEEITVGRIWGGETPKKVDMFEIDPTTCRVRIYLQEQLGVRFRGRQYPLYPEFMRRVRLMLERVVQEALDTRSPVSAEAASMIADEEWPAEVSADHPHIGIYRPRAKRWTMRFAEAFSPESSDAQNLLKEPFEWQGLSGTNTQLKLHLIGRFCDSSGAQTAIALRLMAPDKKEGTNWAGLTGYHRLPFVLLQQRDGNVRPFVFYGEDGALKPYRWHRSKPREAVEEVAAAAKQAFTNLTNGEFDGTVNDWTCDRCPCRIVCPAWIGATVGG